MIQKCFNEAYIDMSGHPAIHFKLKQSLHMARETAVNHVYQVGIDMKGFTILVKYVEAATSQVGSRSLQKHLSTWDYVEWL